jgi:hypothetical protein
MACRHRRKDKQQEENSQQDEPCNDQRIDLKRHPKLKETDSPLTSTDTYQCRKVPLPTRDPSEEGDTNQCQRSSKKEAETGSEMVI